MTAKLRILLAFVALICLPFLQGAGGEATAQVSDNFSDGDFTSSPAWSGNHSDFVVNSSQQLQLSASGAGKSYLKIVNTQSLNNCEWKFWIQLNFSPSAGNNARVYLASDQPILSGSLKGYYLQFGEDLANDQVELFRQSGSGSVSICRGTTLISNAFTIGIKVTRDGTGLWKLFVDPTGGSNYVPEASGTDNTFASTSYFGILYEYTSSNITNFFFDDLYIYSPPDTIPAALDSAKVISKNKLDVYFSEEISAVSAQTTANYSVDNGIGFAATATQDSISSRLIHLIFGNDFIDGQAYTLTVTGVQDAAGNNTVNEKFQFLFIRPLPNDVVINEVLFDPFDLGVEWVEIYNRSDKAIDLKDLFLCSRDKNGALSEITPVAPQGYVMLPNTYLVLSKDAAAIKLQYHTENPGGFIDMASLPSLNNDSDKIVLADAEQIILDELHYSASWHLSLLNETKGFSLERINFEAATQQASNWHSAASRTGGATPAFQNSQYFNGESGSDVTVSPEIFSPDNDGYNDVLGISYTFDMPGMIGNVQIYDQRGWLEKTLVRNELLASSGIFYWDGFNDEKVRSRLGIYIVYVEAFDISGKVKKYRKSCVLGGKL